MLYSSTKYAPRVTYYLDEICVGSDLSEEGLTAQISHERRRLQSGGSRDDFERTLFAFSNPFLLPKGQLADHRVRMPLDIAERSLNEGRDAVTRLLANMLCMHEYAEGQEMVAEALNRNPRKDARKLVEMYERYPRATSLCLSGRIGSNEVKQAQECSNFRTLVSAMIVYYCALEVQLISLRLRLEERYRFGLEVGASTITRGRKAKDTIEMAESFKFIDDQLSRGRKPGRPPNLVSGMIGSAKRNLDRLLIERPDLDESAIEKLVREFVSSKSRFVRRSLNRYMRTQAWIDKKASRTAASTTDGGETAAVLIAFACIRLKMMANNIPLALDNGYEAGGPSLRDLFSGDMAPIKAGVARLLLVYSRLIFGSPFDGGPLTAQSPTGKLKAAFEAKEEDEIIMGEETIKKAWARKSQRNRVELAATNRALPDFAKWDILPDWRICSNLDSQ